MENFETLFEFGTMLFGHGSEGGFTGSAMELIGGDVEPLGEPIHDRLRIRAGGGAGLLPGPFLDDGPIAAVALEVIDQAGDDGGARFWPGDAR